MATTTDKAVRGAFKAAGAEIFTRRDIGTGAYFVAHWGSLPRLCRVFWVGCDWQHPKPETGDGVSVPRDGRPGRYLCTVQEDPRAADYLDVQVFTPEEEKALRRRLEDRLRKEAHVLAACLTADAAIA